MVNHTATVLGIHSVSQAQRELVFVVLPRRWVVERTFAWLGRCRRLAKDFERSIESSAAWALVAHIRRLTRLIARHCPAN